MSKIVLGFTQALRQRFNLAFDFYSIHTMYRWDFLYKATILHFRARGRRLEAGFGVSVQANGDSRQSSVISSFQPVNVLTFLSSATTGKARY
jgi:hypothetical protein